jgi:phage replication O-like protein O
MASPQLENGYTRLANELLEQFACRAFTQRELAVLLVILRNTYGVKGRKSYPYATRQIAEASGIHQAHVRATIAALQESRVVIVANGEIGIEKDHDLWTTRNRTGNTKSVRTDLVRTESVRSHQISAHDRTESVRSHDAQPPVCNEWQAPKERKKDPPSNTPIGGDRTHATGSALRFQRGLGRPSGDPWLWTQTDLAVLVEAGEAVGVGAGELADKIGRALAKRDDHACDDWHAMEPALVALWCQSAIGEAVRATGRRGDPTVCSYAARIIGDRLAAGLDLLASKVTPMRSRSSAAEAKRAANDAGIASLAAMGYFDA